jgi:hypothetical protein
MTLVDAGVHFQHVQVIRCDIKPGSVDEDLYKQKRFDEQKVR